MKKSSENSFYYGFVCVYHYNFREKAAYCYENTETGEIQWEYPQMENTETASEESDDDAMDICTTPPPNEHEVITATVFQTNGKLMMIKNICVLFLSNFNLIFLRNS